MTTMLRLIFTMIALLSASCGSHNSQDLYCQGLIEAAKQGDIASRLEEWSVNNVFRNDLQRLV